MNLEVYAPGPGLSVYCVVWKYVLPLGAILHAGILYNLDKGPVNISMTSAINMGNNNNKSRLLY